MSQTSLWAILEPLARYLPAADDRAALRVTLRATLRDVPKTEVECMVARIRAIQAAKTQSQLRSGLCPLYLVGRPQPVNADRQHEDMEPYLGQFRVPEDSIVCILRLLERGGSLEDNCAPNRIVSFRHKPAGAAHARPLREGTLPHMQRALLSHMADIVTSRSDLIWYLILDLHQGKAIKVFAPPTYDLLLHNYERQLSYLGKSMKVPKFNSAKAC